MREIYKINDNGVFQEMQWLDSIPLIEEGDEFSPNPLYIDTPMPNDIHFSKEFPPEWDGEKWINGATKEEIDELTKPQPHEPTELELLHAQVQASSDYVDFLEDVVVELIQEVYQ